MSVTILSPNPDFRLLLSFSLQLHGFDVMRAPLHSAPPMSAAADSPAVVVADLSHEEAVSDVVAAAGRYPLSSTLVVLSKPGVAMQFAWQLLPRAVAYLPVPVQPAGLVRSLRTLGAGGAEHADTEGRRHNPEGSTCVAHPEGQQALSERIRSILAQLGGVMVEVVELERQQRERDQTMQTVLTQLALLSDQVRAAMPAAAPGPQPEPQEASEAAQESSRTFPDEGEEQRQW